MININNENWTIFFLVSDDEKEFEPTVDMIMNEFDDERTIDEEEELGGQEDQQEEINDLNKEQDMPIEELLKLYGYTKPSAVGGEDQEGKVDELVEEDEEEDDTKNNEDVHTGGDNDDTARKEEESDVESEMRGEKRSYSTLPPNKKPRSELAK